ncbi:MAG: hypothetical protein M4D80_28650 [Myxococcota bacterium]|nr:hypothetical protein [Myxococcota bacterium]
MIARGWVLACVALASACSDDPARVRLVPVRPVATGPCGDARPRPTELTVIAYARSGEVPRSVPVDSAVPVADFPADTEQIGVEARLAGSVIAVGKTAPLAFDDLANGATIPIFMAPPEGFCPLGEMRVARRAPLVARAGDGVLIVGGFDAAGMPIASAERYEPATGTFVDVAVPSLLGEGGFLGATLTPLPDGRVVLAGGPERVATIYNPTNHTFGESVLIEGRAFHSAVATGGDELLLVGGCSAIASGSCSGVVRLGSKLYEATDADTLRELRPSTTLRAGRVGANIFDIGVQLDGKRAFVMAGGLPPPSGQPAVDAADVFSLGATDATAVFGSHFAAAALDGGAVLTAFAPDGDTPNGAASVFPPLADARTVARAPDLAGVRLLALENGRVVGIGGEPMGDVVRYDPMSDVWERVDADGPITSAPVLHRLEDGSVLVLGGAPATNQAFVYRPPLLGPTSGTVTVVPIGAARANVLTPSDPATVTRGMDWVLSAGSEPMARARALVGGPRMTNGSIRVIATVLDGGIGLVAQQTGPGRALVAELVPGAPARLTLFDAGLEQMLCTGDAIAPFGENVELVLEIADDRARLRRDGVELLACDVVGVSGAWGVAAVGAGARVAVETVSLVR